MTMQNAECRMQNGRKRANRPPVVIGITGLIASGKTTAAGFFRKAGFYVIDVDEFAHGLYKKGLPLYRALVKKYGMGILQQNGEINRPALAKLAFSGRPQYMAFNHIVFPFLNKALKSFVLNRPPSTANRQPGFIVLDMAVLFESGFYRNADFIVFVSAPEKLLLARMNARGGGNLKKVLKFQKIYGMNKKIALSDYILYNNKNMPALAGQAKEAIKKIEEKYGPKRP